MNGLAGKIYRHLRRRLVDTPRGLGHPVPAAAFDREYASGHWDLLFSPEELPRNQALLDFIAAHGAHASVLDIGCGSGRLAQLLVPHAPVRYVGLDLSPEALRRARALGLSFGEFVLGNFETWRPAPAETFDVIVFNESIGYARDPAATLASFAAHLALDGEFLVSYFRSGNYVPLWRRITSRFPVASATVVNNPRGQTWDIRTLRPARSFSSNAG